MQFRSQNDMLRCLRFEDRLLGRKIQGTPGTLSYNLKIYEKGLQITIRCRNNLQILSIKILTNKQYDWSRNIRLLLWGMLGRNIHFNLIAGNYN